MSNTKMDTPPKLPIPVNLRFQNVADFFKSKFGNEPEFYARCSGRVNLIGEHIDYHGYAVLPMAIEQDVLMAACATNDGRLTLANTNSQYSDFECALSEFTIDKSAPKWYHYFLCGVQGIAEHLSTDPGKLKGMQVVLDGRVPPSAGLSSSSAVVCAATLASAQLNCPTLPSKTELATICQFCEHHIGTEGGGMDQSIIFLAEAGMAKLIEFAPIRATDVCLPEGGSFVIANSCAEHNKAASGEFNTRVAEGRLACQVLAKARGLPWREFTRLGQLQDTLGLSLEDMVALVKDTLHPGAYSKQEVCEILGVTEEELDGGSLSMLRHGAVASFMLHDRALHVYSEAARVRSFQNVCAQQPTDALQQLGDLMNTSHESCRDFYQCSCTELDTLCKLARDSGALGSRLTGAGWGGCCVSLVPTQQVPEFLNKLKKGYYDRSEQLLGKFDTAVFATLPSSGAVIYV